MLIGPLQGPNQRRIHDTKVEPLQASASPGIQGTSIEFNLRFMIPPAEYLLAHQLFARVSPLAFSLIGLPYDYGRLDPLILKKWEETVDYLLQTVWHSDSFQNQSDSPQHIRSHQHLLPQHQLFAVFLKKKSNWAGQPLPLRSKEECKLY